MLELKEKIKKLPETPGVYLFKNSRETVLYVGKAVSLRDRVRSYFSDANNFTRPIEYVLDQVKKIETKKTDSVLEAYIKEQELIRLLKPKYNVIGKDDKSFVFVCITNEEFPTFLIKRKTDLESEGIKEYSKVYGPFTSKYMIVRALKIMRKIFPYHSAKQKTEKGCLDFQIGLCPGPYAGEVDQKQYRKNIRGIEMMLKGKKKTLMKQIKKDMKKFSKDCKFEKAAEKRNQFFALGHIQDMAIINDENLVNHDFSLSNRKKMRIEGYDISNIGGQFNVGSMVVFEGCAQNIEPSSSHYRKFKIKTIDGADDIGAMKEILERRFGNKWSLPDLILLDGGKGHLSVGKQVLCKRKLKIPILAIAKGSTRKKLDVYSHGEIPHISKKIITQVRDEAHRFAINYHKKLRKKEFLK
ncbi:MAG: GIY-YIG nuclease family protein [Patescibacteria group bacterium]|nr:GIY-YIG nuclease family protein [Patescibacteria group bacterium]